MYAFRRAFVGSALLVVGLFASHVAWSHDGGYEDFYNMKQGVSKSADSGCRLMLCLANPKGPMSESACIPDVKEMYFEIAMAAYGHGYIPQCIGNMGANIATSVNKKGESAGIYFNNEKVTVWRKDGEHGWRQIYASTRTPVHYPVAGKTDDTEPRVMWNAEAGNRGRLDTASSGGAGTASGSSGTLGANGLPAGLFADPETLDSGNGSLSAQPGDDAYDPNNPDAPNASAAFKKTVQVREYDLVQLRKKINVFSGDDYRNRTADEFDQAVVASPPLQSSGNFSAIITSEGPAKAYFMKGDKVVVSRFQGNPGDVNKRRAPTTKYGSYETAQGAATNELKTITYKDAEGKIQTMALPEAAEFDQDGKISYVDNAGLTQIITPVNTEGQRITLREVPLAPAPSGSGDQSSNTRTNDYFFDYTTKDSEGNEQQNSVNVLDQLMPASFMPAE